MLIVKTYPFWLTTHLFAGYDIIRQSQPQVWSSHDNQDILHIHFHRSWIYPHFNCQNWYNIIQYIELLINYTLDLHFLCALESQGVYNWRSSVISAQMGLKGQKNLRSNFFQVSGSNQPGYGLAFWSGNPLERVEHFSSIKLSKIMEGTSAIWGTSQNFTLPWWNPKGYTREKSHTSCPFLLLRVFLTPPPPITK